MATSSTIVLVVSVLIVAVFVSASTVQAGGHEFGWMPARSTCNGNLGECLEEDEFEMDSEINRRILATSQYISYEALKRNSVPCSRRGASYYNCRSGAQANPYKRGCSAITRCRS
ncbi:rapid alkalinization factor [Aristolochia californica]|uniref:rapid alkalinization factor n=1 Tax=Aristolochia californica TaxID=171875 RepID=UPI0035D91F46